MYPKKPTWIHSHTPLSWSIKYKIDFVLFSFSVFNIVTVFSCKSFSEFDMNKLKNTNYSFGLAIKLIPSTTVIMINPKLWSYNLIWLYNICTVMICVAASSKWYDWWKIALWTKIKPGESITLSNIIFNIFRCIFVAVIAVLCP